MVIKFRTVEQLYEDMIANNQAFATTNREYLPNGDLFTERTDIYRVVVCDNNRIEFHTSKLGGSSLYIKATIGSSEKELLNNYTCEYRLNIVGREDPLVFTGYSK